MQAGTYDEALRRVADQLWAEFVDPDAPELPGTGPSVTGGAGMGGPLDPRREELTARVREVLAGIAATLGAKHDAPPTEAMMTVLEGAAFVMRGELAEGSAEGALRLMPSLVFLVAILVADQDRALELSRRTTQLTDTLGP